VTEKAAAEEVAAIVTVKVCAVPGLSVTEEPGAKLQLTPAGKFVQVRFTVPLNPDVPAPAPLGLNTSCVLAEVPGLTVTVAGFKSRLKLPFTSVKRGQIPPIAAASTEPSPVASSYPLPAAQQDRTYPEPLETQFGLPCWQTTALLPVVTS